MIRRDFNLPSVLSRVTKAPWSKYQSVAVWLSFNYLWLGCSLQQLLRCILSQTSCGFTVQTTNYGVFPLSDVLHKPRRFFRIIRMRSTSFETVGRYSKKGIRRFVPRIAVERWALTVFLLVPWISFQSGADEPMACSCQRPPDDWWYAASSRWPALVSQSCCWGVHILFILHLNLYPESSFGISNGLWYRT